MEEEGGRRVSALLSFITDIGAIVLCVCSVCFLVERRQRDSFLGYLGECPPPHTPLLLDGTAAPTYRGPAAASPLTWHAEIKPVHPNGSSLKIITGVLRLTVLVPHVCI